jgi:hypothetical protein
MPIKAKLKAKAKKTKSPAKKPAIKKTVKPVKKIVKTREKTAGPILQVTKLPNVSAKKLMDAQGDACFWAANGSVFKNIAELRDALFSMDDATFVHHMNAEKNDFANWIENALGDSLLAEKIRHLNKKDDAVREITVYLKTYYNIG